ncbi:flagellar biosynthesis protein FlhF [Niallia circulans]|uniref:flagellar biosynthesis protein FlhF n=1 Tax=Niallia circulans TaxID=1397 RepID=UPI000BA7CD88|nr:flagellar biosynthesis protein FlhF [Niallia circulans]PAD27174.1 flagellar biosynthesis protein FlhF [Niallia circulans]PAD89669.1 flagellar biosynthesis protein FlhF [Niallia circulans]
MKIQKYVARDMPEAMKKIRAELGNDAVILHSKVIYTGGFLGLFKKRNIEVLAAIDPSISETTISKQTKKREIRSPVLIKEPAFRADADNSANNISLKEGEKISDYPEIVKHLNEINQNVKANRSMTFSIPAPITKIVNQLDKQGIDEEIKTGLVKDLVAKWYAAGEDVLESQVSEWARQFLLTEISPFSFGEISLAKKYINVIGPTGVGKTTTLAKIAANIILRQQKSVGFITTDTYRIGAIEQLKTYANILDVPLEVCYSLEDFEHATKKLEECDVILIDTAGRNFRNKKYVEDLMQVVDYKREMETLLVLSMTAKQDDLEEIYQQFSAIKIDAFVFTKLDETSSYGAMINLIVACKKGAAYITTGQNVPDDIVPATPEELVNKLFEVVEE